MAIRGFEKKDPYAGLNQLMQLMNQMGQMQERTQRRFLHMEEELSEGLGNIYDNSTLEARKSHFDRFYQDNKENMDENTLAKFNLVNQQFESQAKSNVDYTRGLEYSKNIGRKVEDSLVAYSDIQGMKDITEEERSDLRAEAMGNVQTLVDDYSTFSGEFRASHGERMGKAGFREDAAYLRNLKEMFAFGIVQAKDDYVFDSAEAEAMQMGIELGSYQPIQDYRTNEKNRNRQIQSTQLKDLDDNYKLAGHYQDIVNKANEFDSMTEEQKADVRDTPWALDINDEEITYGMYEDDNALIDQFDLARDKAVQNVKNIDKSYNKREGVSWLQTGNINENIQGLFEEQEPPPVTPLTSLPKDDDDKIIKEPRGSAIISKEDEEWFTSKAWYPSGGRQGKGWASETTVKKEKLDDFMAMAFEPDNFEDGKLKEGSEIYQMIQKAKKGGSRRMKRLETYLKRYAQAIKNIPETRAKGYDMPGYINKLVDEVENILTTKERFYD